MSRIRTIKPEFWTSEQIVECSPIARLLFIGIWNFCDDYGNHPLSLKALKMRIFPGDDFTLARMQELFDELVSNGQIVLYSHGAGKFFHVVGWHHQKIDRPTQKFPQPTKFDDDSTNDRRAIDDASPPEGIQIQKGRDTEGKGSRERGAALPTPSKTKFIKPTVADVKAYAVEQSQPDFDAAKFIDHYESNGWKVGKTAMKDWQATVRNWIRNGGTQAKGNASGSTEAETAWQNILDGLATHGRFDDGPGKIRSQIGERVWQAMSKIGLKKLDDANDFERQKLKAQFVQNFTQQKGAA